MNATAFDPYIDPASGVLLNRLGIIDADQLAHYFGEVNALHPFREGNGRAQRAFFRQLAAEAGWHIDWTQVSREENIEVSRKSLTGEVELLVRLFDRIVVLLD